VFLSSDAEREDFLRATADTSGAQGCAGWFRATRFGSPFMRTLCAAPLDDEGSELAGHFGDRDPDGAVGALWTGCLHWVHQLLYFQALVWFLSPSRGKLSPGRSIR